MAETRRPNFSKIGLDMGERAQRALGRNHLGRMVVGAVAGSESPAYVQLDWFSQNVSADVRATVTLPGDPHAGRLPRSWKKAAVMATPKEELAALKGQVGLHREAMAYESESVWHIGTLATIGTLFENLTDDEVAAAMRSGPRSAPATMGLWLPDDRTFVSVENVRVVPPVIYNNELPHTYPGVKLT